MTERPYNIINKEEPRGQSVAWHGIPCTARTCVTRLNIYEMKIERYEETIKNMIKTERTALGKSVLKQLAETLDIEVE